MLKKLVAILLISSCVAVPASAATHQEITYDGNKLPVQILDKVNKYTIITVDSIQEIEEFKDESKNVVGNMNKDTKIVYIKNGEDKQQIYYHEVGHVLDDDYNCILSSETGFEVIASIEHDNSSLANRYKQGVNEYFAESFAWYYTKPSLLRECCPMTYAYFDRLVKKYE